MPHGTEGSTVRRKRTWAGLGFSSASTSCSALNGRTSRACGLRLLPATTTSTGCPRGAPRGVRLVTVGGAAASGPAANTIAGTISRRVAQITLIPSEKRLSSRASQQRGQDPPRADRVGALQVVVDDRFGVQAKAVVHGGVDVGGIDRVGGRVGSDAVGGPEDLAAADAAAGEQHRLAQPPVVA